MADLGRVTNLREARDLVRVCDLKGRTLELVPERSTVELEVTMTLASGKIISFWVPVPDAAVTCLNEPAIKCARSVEELAEQLKNDLSGVEDDHDRIVNAADPHFDKYLKERADHYAKTRQDDLSKQVQAIIKSQEDQEAYSFNRLKPLNPFT